MCEHLRRVAVVAVMFGVLVVGSGCTFFCAKGYGPRSREHYAALLPSAPVEQVQQWEKEALTARDVNVDDPGYKRLSKINRMRFDDSVNGYTNYGRWGPLWAVLAGPRRVSHFEDPIGYDREKRRALVTRGEGWHVLAPFLLSRGQTRQYDAKTGQCVGSERWFSGAGSGIGWCECVAPVDAPLGVLMASRESRDVATDINSLEYNHGSAFWLVSGAFACGTKNGRAYLQLAWIPIPLWSVD